MNNGNHLNIILQLGAIHALFRDDGKWYHNLKRFPGVLFDKNGYILFQTEASYLNHPQLQIKKDLHIKNGIESLSGYRIFSEREKQLILGIPTMSLPVNDQLHSSDRSEEVIRIIREISTIIRNKVLVDKIKKLYNNTCQICGMRLKIREYVYYSEVHHIVPLGRPYNGKDRMDNMMCVCPNHHILLDLKAIGIDIASLNSIKHTISEKSVLFHNSMVK